MRAALRGPVMGAWMALLFTLNTLFWMFPVYALILVKLLMPTKRLRNAMGQAVAVATQGWASCNAVIGDFFLQIDWDIRLPVALRRDGQYLVMCNHQTWNDIHVLMRAFGPRAPFFRFFIKQELIWVPVLGLAWWGLDYPFMKRYTRAQIEKNPQLRGKDMETTRKACEKYAAIPVSILNFVEGTRFTQEKHDRQASPFTHLLKPKSGGVAFTLAAMGDKLSALLDVTIVYPEGAKSFWDFLAGRVRRVIVDVRSLRVPSEFFGGDYEADAAFRARVNSWVAQIWADKDRRIGELLREAG